MKKEDLLKEIDELAAQHRATDEEDSWLWESLEANALRLILLYLHEHNISIPGYDLSTYIDEESPESSEPVIDHWEELMEMLRIADHPESEFPKEVTELISYYERTFWPEFFG